MGRIEEILLILAVGLLFFGPNKMVDFAKGLGTAMREFKKAANPDPEPTKTASAPSASAQPTETKAIDLKDNSTV